MSLPPKSRQKTDINPPRQHAEEKKTEEINLDPHPEEEKRLNPDRFNLDEKIYKINPRNQIISSFICNLGMLCMGCSMGWSSPVVNQLVNTHWYSESEATWSGTLIPIGCLVSLPLFGFISANYGRKPGGYFCGLMFLLGITLIAVGPTSLYMLFGRFFCGIGSGSANALPTLYIGETVEVKYRGLFGSLLLVVESIGILYSYCVGMHLENRNHLSFYILPVPIIFLICFKFIPETPMQELRNGDEMAALKSLSWLRSLPLNSKQLRDELNHAAMQLGMKLPLPPCPPKQPFFQRIFHRIRNICHRPIESSNQLSTTAAAVNSLKHPFKLLFGKRSGRQGLHITFALITAQTFTGMFAILTYANNIFEDAGTTISPDLAAVICGFFFMAGAIFGCIFMDKFGRRFLQISSCLIIAACYASLSISLQIIKNGNQDGFLTLIPLITLPVSIFANNMGLTVIPFVIMTEIFDLEVKDLATSICMAYVWISVIILMTFFPSIIEVITLINTFYIFAAIALLSVVHSYYFLIETKDKSLDEILLELSATDNENSADVENNQAQ